MEEFLDDQVMEEEVDAAAADLPEEDPSAKTAKEASAKPAKDPSATTTTVPPADDPADVAQPRRTRHAIR
ncbi:hypothetical protein ACXWO4_11370, partial [Streptococcus pyogenes]